MKKVKKLAVLLILVAILFNSIGAVAKEEDESEKSIFYAKQVAWFYIKSVDKRVEITEATVINNIYQKPEVVLFELGEKGYIVVNLHDLSVPEMAFDNMNPYDGVNEPIYNGPLNYYYMDNGKYVSIDGKATFSIKEITKVYNKKERDDKEEYIMSLLSVKKDSWERVKSKKTISGLRKWQNPGHCCGAVASAIYMRYMYDYVNPVYGFHGQLSEGAFIEEMKRWVGGAASNECEMRDGLNNYLFDYDTGNEVIMLNYNFFTVKSRINCNRPVIQRLREYQPRIDHWVVIYGYCIYPGNAEFIIINDGNGSDDIYIEADDSYLGEMIYLIR